MKRQSLLLLFVGSLLLISSLPVEAQTTGRLRGTVTDSDGLVMPGVTITLSGEVVMGGSRTAISGESGAYRFTALPPGVYSAVAELEGFDPASIEAVQVSLNATAVANFVMYPSEFAEMVTVTSEATLVDVTTSASGNNYTSEFIKDLPTNRNFYDIMSVSPGIAISSEGSDRQIAFGSNMQSNAWHVDGIESSAPETGTTWIYQNPDAVEEVQVLGIGAPAEFGNMLGAAFNVVTKSGGNQLRGTFNMFTQSNSLTDSRDDYLVDDTAEFQEFERDEFWDITATLGGPIKKDRVWYFLAYEYWRDGMTQPGLDPAFTVPGKSDVYDAKISTRINDRNLLDVKGQYNDWHYPEAYPNYTQSATPFGEHGVNWMWGLNYQSVFNDRTFMEVRGSGWNTTDDYPSKTGSTDPGFIDYSPEGGGPPQYSGGLLYPWTYETGTTQVDVAVSHFADDFIKGDHDFKFGVRYGDGFSTAIGALSGLYYYRYVYEYDYYGTIYPYEYFYKVEYSPYYYGNDQTALSAYVDDSWRVNSRLTLNLGLRYDRHEGVIPSFPRLDSNANPTGQSLPGIDPVFTWNNVSPRLGLAYNAGANYRTVIRAFFGMFYDGNVGGNWNAPPPFPPDWTYSFSDSPNGPWEVFDVWSAGANNVDPDLEAPLTYQYMLGFEHELMSNYSVGAMVVYKDTSNLVGWENIGDGVYEPFPYTDPFTGREYTLLDQIEQPTYRKGNGPGFTTVGQIDEYWQDYFGVVLTFNRRFTDWWDLRTSYTWSESTGVIPRMFSQTQFNPPYGSRAEGTDPNNFINLQDGQLLQGDRTHMLRIQANFHLPWKLVAATNINLQSGRPYSRQIREFGLGQGSVQMIMEEANNSLRHPFQSVVDFSIGKRFGLPGDGVFKLDVQFFNLLNVNASDFFTTLILQEGDRFNPDWFVLPRRVMLRLGVEY